MMGRSSQDQGQLFYTFILKGSCQTITWCAPFPVFSIYRGFRAELAPHYSHTGRPSIDPVLMIRRLIIGYVFAIRSNARCAARFRLNLAYRWFCGLGIEDKIPDSFGVLGAHGNERFRDSDIFRAC